MTPVESQKARRTPLILTSTHEKILRAIYCYRYMTKEDVARLIFSPTSLTHCREILTALSGGTDFQTNHYLYRFRLPSVGNSERIYTLGSRGRNYLENEVGLPVDWWFRPYRYKYFSYAHVLHSLLITRFVVAAHSWCRTHPDFTLSQIRTSYELARTPTSVSVTTDGKPQTLPVVPDAWLLFERKDNKKFPIWLEVDRGMEYQQRFKQHIRSRIEFIRSGQYNKLFCTQAVLIAYATSGQTPEYRHSRRQAMCTWTMEVLKEQGRENWAGIFRFAAIEWEQLYSTPLFTDPLWDRPYSPTTPVPLFPL